MDLQVAAAKLGSEKTTHRISPSSSTPSHCRHPIPTMPKITGVRNTPAHLHQTSTSASLSYLRPHPCRAQLLLSQRTVYWQCFLTVKLSSSRGKKSCFNQGKSSPSLWITCLLTLNVALALNRKVPCTDPEQRFWSGSGPESLPTWRSTGRGSCCYLKHQTSSIHLVNCLMIHCVCWLCNSIHKPLFQAQRFSCFLLLLFVCMPQLQPYVFIESILTFC